MEQEKKSPVLPAPRKRGRTHLEIYDFIVDFIDQNGFPPTVREICRAMGLSSPGMVNAHLKRLEKEHFIERYANHARAIRVRGGV